MLDLYFIPMLFLSLILLKLLGKGGGKIINRSGNKTDILCLVA